MTRVYLAAAASTLRDLIRRGESETLEFKESFGREAVETVCAFGNTKGGTLLIGVDDHGVVRGIPGGAKTLKAMAIEIAQGTGLQPSVGAVVVKGKRVIRIEIPESRIRPVMFHGKGYLRVGSTTRQMGVEEVTRIVLSSVGMTWDEVPEVRATLADISIAKVRDFLRMAKEKGRRPGPAKVSPIEVLEKLKLLPGGKPTRAAILLFGKDPQGFYGHALVKIGRFRGETLIVDDREVRGALFEQVEGTMGYFREKLDTRFVMTGRPQRDVIWEYPLEALREAVTNAVCHREYLSTAHTQVRVYDHELMVWNDGDLPGGLSVGDLKRKHSSRPRNRQIAEMFFYAGLIEGWGSGIGKMMDECKSAGMPQPVFEEVQGFRVTFKKAPETAPVTSHRTSHDTSHEHPMSSTEINVLAFCREPRSRAEIAKKLGLSPEYIRRHVLPSLIRAGKLKHTFPGKPQSKKQRYLTK